MSLKQSTVVDTSDVFFLALYPKIHYLHSGTNLQSLKTMYSATSIIRTQRSCKYNCIFLYRELNLFI